MSNLQKRARSASPAGARGRISEEIQVDRGLSFRLSVFSSKRKASRANSKSQDALNGENADVAPQWPAEAPGDYAPVPAQWTDGSLYDGGNVSAHYQPAPGASESVPAQPLKPGPNLHPGVQSDGKQDHYDTAKNTSPVVEAYCNKATNVENSPSSSPDIYDVVGATSRPNSRAPPPKEEAIYDEAGASSRLSCRSSPSMVQKEDGIYDVADTTTSISTTDMMRLGDGALQACPKESDGVYEEAGGHPNIADTKF